MTEQTSEPRTGAGRALYEVSEHMTWSNGAAVSNHYMLNTVLAIESEAFMDGARASRENRLAIEAEAAAPASPDVVDEEAVLDNAVPSIARFGRVPRTEVIRSIVTAIHEQGMRVAAAYAEGESND
jgi:hypothetical protein